MRDLIRAGDVRISEHGYDRLAEDGLRAREAVAGVQEAVVVEEYLNYPKGPCILFCRGTERANPSMWCGASQRAMISQWFWLPHTGRIRSGGMKHLCGDDEDETAKEDKIRT